MTDSIYSTVLKTHRAYTIYLPQSYDKEADRKYPILYLLHGMSGVLSLIHIYLSKALPLLLVSVIVWEALALPTQACLSMAIRPKDVTM